MNAIAFALAVVTIQFHLVTIAPSTDWAASADVDFRAAVAQPANSQASASTESGTTSSDKPSGQWSLLFRENSMVVFTGLLAISTIGLWIATFQIARHTRVSERPYLSVEPLGLSRWRGSAQTLGHIGIHNSGHLPARSVSWKLHIASDTAHDRRHFPITAEARGNHVIVSGSTVTHGTAPADIPHGEGQYCYVWGEISYEDGFGKHRYTKFCHRYNCSIETFAESNRIDAKHARMHDYGNDAI
jgi:hypothetical protein